MRPTQNLAGAKLAHPLDVLSAEEVGLAVELLRTAKALGPDTRFTHVQLEEPAKADILAWKPGAELPRRAAAMLFDCKTGLTHTAIVDLGSRRSYVVAGTADQSSSLRPGADNDRGSVQGRRHRQGRCRLARRDEKARPH